MYYYALFGLTCKSSKSVGWNSSLHILGSQWHMTDNHCFTWLQEQIPFNIQYSSIDSIKPQASSDNDVSLLWFFPQVWHCVNEGGADERAGLRGTPQWAECREGPAGNQRLRSLWQTPRCCILLSCLARRNKDKDFIRTGNQVICLFGRVWLKLGT